MKPFKPKELFYTNIASIFCNLKQFFITLPYTSTMRSAMRGFKPQIKKKYFALEIISVILWPVIWKNYNYKWHLRGQWYKTFLGVIYANSGIFPYDFGWGYTDSDVITFKKVL